VVEIFDTLIQIPYATNHAVVVPYELYYSTYRQAKDVENKIYNGFGCFGKQNFFIVCVNKKFEGQFECGRRSHIEMHTHVKNNSRRVEAIILL
jgi:hypothetical protein